MEEDKIKLSNLIQWEKSRQIEKEHKWAAARFNKPTFCEICTSMIWGLIGKQGQKCSVCQMPAHHDCISRTDIKNCQDSKQIILQKEHTLAPKNLSTPTFCISCRGEISNEDLCCSICRVSCHSSEECSKAIPISCPQTFFTEEPDLKQMEHYWIFGIRGKCSQCQKHSNHNILSGFKCFWCNLKVCGLNCKDAVEKECNLGQLKAVALPPFCVIMSEKDPKIPYKVINLPKECTKPLIVFVNPRSGGQMGVEVIQNLNFLLNPLQVFDLTKGGPDPGLEIIKNNPEIDWLILAAGGDGTVAWVLSAIDKYTFTNYAVGVIPLGTGNDLARTLGWGGGFKDATTLRKLIPTVHEGEIRMLDRWYLIVEEKDEKDQWQEKSKKILNNYFSIGIDAKVALKFHRKREKNPGAFNHQTVNKMWYAKFGTEVIISGCSDLNKEIKLKIGKEKVDLQDISLEAVVVVNLPSCYAGALLWPSNYPPKYNQQRIDDSLIEVVGIKSSVHLGQVQTGMASPIILGQGTEVLFELTVQQPVQLDGEPWEQTKCRIRIKKFNEVQMWIRKEKAHPLVLDLPRGNSSLTSSKQ